jgi:pimeloyl-ACP methyl ester carboxylesterase
VLFKRHIMMRSYRKEQLHGGRPRQRKLSTTLRAMRFLFVYLGRLAPALMGRWAYHLWFRTRRFPESAAGRRIAGQAIRETLPVNGLPVAIYRWGTGPIVLFVHGWSGRGSQAAAFVEPLLHAGYQVLAVDAPGHGETPGHSTNILECADVLRAIDQAYGPLHGAITHSFGGMVLAYALQHGMHMERVVSLSAPATVGFVVDGFAQTLSMPPAVVANLQQRLEQRFEGVVQARISMVNNVRDLAVPALVIHDADDASVPWQQGEMIAAAWPGARFMKTQGLGHGRILRSPTVVEAAVTFISQ